MVWHALPNDVARDILRRVCASRRHDRAVVCVQRSWRGYRTRVLVGRFRMLRYLHEFRAWNPTVGQFLHRARL